MTNEYSEWCKRQFSMLVDGGTWMVPRSGLIFTRRGDTLVLTGRMPFTEELAQAAAAGDEGVPPTAEALRKYQDEDYNVICDQFQIAGIEVTSDC